MPWRQLSHHMPAWRYSCTWPSKEQRATVVHALLLEPKSALDADGVGVLCEEEEVEGVLPGVRDTEGVPVELAV